MKETTIDGQMYFEVEIGYKVTSYEYKFIIYTTEPSRIDYMINRLVDFKAEKIAKERLEKLISEKVRDFLKLN